MGAAEQRLDGAIAYRSLVRYDAYGELSGHQSTTIALLDAERNGVVLSSIVRRDTARIYCKQVIDGGGELELSPEEAEAVRLALAGEPAATLDGCASASSGRPGPTARRRCWRTARRGSSRSRCRRSTTRSPRSTRAASTRALVPIENSLEGAVNATLDALAPGRPTSRSPASSSTRSTTA